MGWKTIKGRNYYYRNSRQNGRMVTTYWGSGESAVLISEIDRCDRRDRNLDRMVERERRDDDREFDAFKDQILMDAKAGAAAFLESNGFHRHKSQWRRKRTGANMTTPTGIQLAEPQPTLKAPTPSNRTVPKSESRGLDRWAVHTICAKLTGKKSGEHAFDCVYNDILDHAAELAGPNPTPIEKTLAESASLAWAALRYTETHGVAAEGRSLRQAAYDLSRTDNAHRRYVSALKALAQVRRLAGPSVQVVNIGGNNQTNVMGANSAHLEPD